MYTPTSPPHTLVMRAIGRRSVKRHFPLLDSMLHTAATLTNICEDTVQSVKIERCELKPFNRVFINDEYLTRVSSEYDDSCEHDAPLCPNTNLKYQFRMSHWSVSHPCRASLWYRLLRQEHVHHRHKFQQAVERYPDDIR